MVFVLSISFDEFSMEFQQAKRIRLHCKRWSESKRQQNKQHCEGWCMLLMIGTDTISIGHVTSNWNRNRNWTKNSKQWINPLAHSILRSCKMASIPTPPTMQLQRNFCAQNYIRNHKNMKINFIGKQLEKINQNKKKRKKQKKKQQKLFVHQ